jgi:hypothetical protein
MARKSTCPPCPPCAEAAPAAAAPAPKPRAAVKVPASAKAFQPAALSLPAKGPAVQTESVQHGTIEPVPSYPIRGCCTKPAKGKTCNMPPRAGQVDLVFPSRKDAEKHGVPFGPALQFCTGVHEGKIVPMKDPHSAKRIMTAYTACVAKGSAVEACIVETKNLSGTGSKVRVTRRKVQRLVRRLGRRRR